ncbi:hypothetical protein Bbelb_185660 [Branchiostoma belcheri]|nr:hypothetical protein Bbelb_185660 [Branchiostoma belcheri]
MAREHIWSQSQSHLHLVCPFLALACPIWVHVRYNPTMAHATPVIVRILSHTGSILTQFQDTGVTDVSQLVNKIEENLGIKEAASKTGLQMTDTTLARYDGVSKNTFAIHTIAQLKLEHQLFDTRSELVVTVKERRVILSAGGTSDSPQIVVKHVGSTQTPKAPSTKRRGRKRKATTEEDTSLFVKIKNGEPLKRTERQEENLQKLKDGLADLGGSSCSNELSARCGMCHKFIKLPEDRTWEGRVKFFKKTHHDLCKTKTASVERGRQLVVQSKVAMASWLGSAASTSRSGHAEDQEFPDINDDIPAIDTVEVEFNDAYVDDTGTFPSVQDGSSPCKDQTFPCADDQFPMSVSFEYADTIAGNNSTGQIEMTQSPDSDICTDSDSDEEVVETQEMSTSVEIPVCLQMIDPLAFKLHEARQAGFIPDDRIMYKWLSGNLEYMLHGDSQSFQWDEEVIEFYRSLKFHGGEKTVNLLRGPMHLGQGRGVAITLGPFGFYLALDFDPMKGTSRLVKVRTHNPVDTTVLKTGLVSAHSVAYDKGVAFVCEKRTIAVVEVEGTVALKVSSFKKLADISVELERKGLPTNGSMQQRRARLQNHLNIVETTYGPNKTNQRSRLNIVGGNNICPGAIWANVDGDLMVGDDASKTVITVHVTRDGIGLIGSMAKFADYPGPVDCVKVLSVCTDSGVVLYATFKGDQGGLFKFVLEQWQRLVHNGTDVCKAAHTVIPYDVADSALLFTDTGSHQVKTVTRIGTVQVLAGSGSPGLQDGTSQYAEFYQPRGVCKELSCLLVTDVATGSIRLITNTDAAALFLEKTGGLYRAFGMHVRHEDPPQKSVAEACDTLDDLNAFLKACKEEVNEARQKTGATNGKEGTVSSKTQGSVQLLADGMRDFHANLMTLNNDYKPDLSSLLTLATESIHATHHLKHPTATVLDYAQEFSSTMNESLKRMAFWSVYYHTHPKSYYPVPSNKLPLSQFPMLRPLKPKKMRKQDESAMKCWAAEYGKVVRQRTVRQETTMYKAGTLPLNLYTQQMPAAQPLVDQRDEGNPRAPEVVPATRPPEGTNDSEGVSDQSEYDSGSSSEDDPCGEVESAGDSSGSETEKEACENSWRTRSLTTRSGRLVAANRRLQGYLMF